MDHADTFSPASIGLETKPSRIRRLWAILGRPSARISLGALLLLGFVAGILFWNGFNLGLEATNNETFCRTCHEMDDGPYREYRGSVHDQNRTGVRATCPDCHVPHTLAFKLVRKVQASKEVLMHLLGEMDSREKFEATRPKLARHVWTVMKETDSRECRTCHKSESMDLMRQNARARTRHEQAADQGKTCIDCHKGIAHRLPAGALDTERELNETWNATHPDH